MVNVKQKYLKNGLKLIILPIAHSPLHWFSLRLRGGSDFEDHSWANYKAKRGSFFLLSQMFFTSGSSLSKDELNALQKKNAIDHTTVTSEAFFGFNLSYLKEKSNVAVKILKAITTREKFVKKEFDQEKEEILFSLQREKESGERLSYRAFIQHFLKDSPYDQGLKGSIETVKKISQRDLLDIWKDYFSPKNAVAVLAGKVDKKDIEKIESVLLKTLPEKKSHPAKLDLLYREDFLNRFKKIKKRTIFETYGAGKQTFVKLGFATPSLKDHEIALARILQAFLTGMGGPLFHLRSQEYIKNGVNLGGRAYVIGARLISSFGFGGLIFYTSLREDALKEWQWAIDSFLEETKKLRNKGIDKEKLEEAKRSLIASRYLRMGKMSYRAANYATYESYGLGFRRWEEEIDKLKDINQEDVLKFCQKYLTEDNYIAHVFFPN